MSEYQKKLLETQLWATANELRGKMDADEFCDDILGFICDKYLSEKQYLCTNKLLTIESNKDYALESDPDNIEAIKEEPLEKLGYFLQPTELFSAVAQKGNANTKGESNFILEDLQAIINSIERSTKSTEFDIKKNKVKLPHPAEQQKIANFLTALDRKIDLVAQKLTQAQIFRKGLLQQMFV